VLSQEHISPQTPTRRDARRGRRNLSGLGAGSRSGLSARHFWRTGFRSAHGRPIAAKRRARLPDRIPGPARTMATRYRFWVQGAGSSGYKRDPYARELDPEGFPNCFCILRGGDGFPWHDQDFRHAVIFPTWSSTSCTSGPSRSASRALPRTSSTLPLKSLISPISASMFLQPLPVDEQEANPNMGYSGADLFSPRLPLHRGRGLAVLSRQAQ